MQEINSITPKRKIFKYMLVPKDGRENPVPQQNNSTKKCAKIKIKVGTLRDLNLNKSIIVYFLLSNLFFMCSSSLSSRASSGSKGFLLILAIPFKISKACFLFLRQTNLKKKINYFVIFKSFTSEIQKPKNRPHLKPKQAPPKTTTNKFSNLLLHKQLRQ